MPIIVPGSGPGPGDGDVVVHGARPLTARGREWLDWLPVVLRESPDHLAVLHSLARESERMEAAIELARAQAFPQTADVLLKVWEHELGITVEPAGQTLVQRRATVIAMLRRMRGTPAGRDWESNVTALVGSGWTYEEHVPGDVGSPPENTVRVELPFAPSSGSYARAERLIRQITPAHLDLIVQFIGGFVLDESQLDQEGLG